MKSAADITSKAQILIRKPAAVVFDAFARSETMSKFWFTRRDAGLRQGEATTWYMGAQPDAPQFDVRVKALKRPSSIVMEWGDSEVSPR